EDMRRLLSVAHGAVRVLERDAEMLGHGGERPLAELRQELARPDQRIDPDELRIKSRDALEIGPARAPQLLKQEAAIEGRVIGDRDPPAEELAEVREDLAEFRRARDLFVCDAVDLDRVVG